MAFENVTMFPISISRFSSFLFLRTDWCGRRRDGRQQLGAAAALVVATFSAAAAAALAAPCRSTSLQHK